MTRQLIFHDNADAINKETNPKVRFQLAMICRKNAIYWVNFALLSAMIFLT